ncbi:MAG TPA: hypothetical protein VFU98_07955 [Microlunatus sp.]|nr:hypothetical protein [Microlunatus sp.]
MLNTPLFVGFPGFVSKLWLTADQRGVYRGIYQWDGPQLAEHYARALWRVLELVSVRGSICYRVLPGADRDAMLDHPEGIVGDPLAGWWRVAEPGMASRGSVCVSPAPASSGTAHRRSDHGDRSAQAGPSPLDGC